MTPASRNSSAPPTVSCTAVGGASEAGRVAAPMTTMLALPAAGSTCSSLLTASCSAVRSFASSVRVCTLSTVCPGSAASARSVMRRLACATSSRSACGCVASGSLPSPESRAANATNCWAARSASRCACSGVSPVPEILMMLPSAAAAATRSRSSPTPSAPPPPDRASSAATRSSTTELVAICAWVISSRSCHAPGSSTDADVVYRGGNSREPP